MNAASWEVHVVKRDVTLPAASPVHSQTGADNHTVGGPADNEPHSLHVVDSRTSNDLSLGFTVS